MKYGYARVSTSGQARNGNSLKDQEEALHDAGAEKIYIDCYTGTKVDRPEFDKLLSVLRPGDELIVTKLDRFARTAPDGATLVRRLVNAGISVNILNMGKANNTPMGKLTVTMLLAFAEFERDMIVERTTAGKEYARAHKEGYREGRPRKEVECTLLPGESVSAACKRLGVSRSYWYARA